MTNNNILRNIQSALKIDNIEILKIYKILDKAITIEDVEDALRDEHDEKYIQLSDDGFALFLDALITHRRGPSDKKSQKIDLTNNTILKKLRVAFNLKDNDMLRILGLGSVHFSKSELTPYFRSEEHKNYRHCSDTLLNSFIEGLKKSELA